MGSEKLYRNTLNKGNRNDDNPCIYQSNNQVHYSPSISEGESNGSSSGNYF